MSEIMVKILVGVITGVVVAGVLAMVSLVRKGAAAEVDVLARGMAEMKSDWKDALHEFQTGFLDLRDKVYGMVQTNQTLVSDMKHQMFRIEQLASQATKLEARLVELERSTWRKDPPK